MPAAKAVPEAGAEEHDYPPATVTLRFTADFLDVLNMPGMNQPDSSSGIASLRNSANSPRHHS
jgi:hypothetical protein